MLLSVVIKVINNYYYPWSCLHSNESINMAATSTLGRLTQDDACQRKLQATASAYISDLVEGIPGRARKLLQGIVESSKELRDDSCECVPGEYERAPLLTDVLHEALVHAVSKGLGASDACGLVQILAGLLEIISEAKNSGLREREREESNKIVHFVVLSASCVKYNNRLIKMVDRDSIMYNL